MAATKGIAPRIRGIAATALLAVAMAGCSAQPSTTEQPSATAPTSSEAVVSLPTRTATTVGATATSTTPATAASPTPATTRVPAPTPLPIPEAIAGALSNPYANVDWFQAMATVTMDTGAGGVITAIVRQWFKQPGMVKLEIIRSTGGQLAPGSEIIFNGRQLTMYDVAANQLIQIQDLPQLMLFFNLPQLQTLPMIQLLQGQKYLSELASRATVTVRGRDTVANRECTLVQLTPDPGSSAAFQEIRLCLDSLTMVPLRIQAIGTGGALLASIEYSTFDRIAQVTEETFNFRPPTTAKEVSPSPEQVAEMAGFQPVTLQEMQARAGFSLFQPSVLPNGMALRSVRQATFSNNVLVALFYGTEAQNSMAVLVERPVRLQIPGIRLGQPASQNGFAGQLYDGTDLVQLEWVEGDTFLTLASTLPKAQAMEMAGSVR